MPIPIQNIYYLLCYAWDRLDTREHWPVGVSEAENTLELLANAFVNGTTHLLKSGFFSEYITENQEIRGIKGKLLLTESLQKQLLFRGKTICSTDEFSANILLNQIIKTTLLQLDRTKDLSSKTKERTAQLLKKLTHIEEITLQKSHFNQVILHRNTARYGLLLDVCELLYESLLPTEEGGIFLFQDFWRDERKMAVLFEAFIRNFYTQQLRGATVSRPKIYWQIKGENTKYLPQMQSDILLTLPNHKVLIDTKFYTETFQRHHQTPKFRSEHLYQIFAYMENYRYAQEGILLYPVSGYHASEKYEHKNGYSIRVETINLNQHWQQIHQDLLKILEENITG